MTETPSKPTPYDGLPLEAKELAAFALFKALLQPVDAKDSRPLGAVISLKSWETCAEADQAELHWRDDKNLRFIFRSFGRVVVEELLQQGFTIRPPREKQMLDQLDAVVTVPSHPAYQLTDDI
jgi:hypothetical protein